MNRIRDIYRVRPPSLMIAALVWPITFFSAIGEAGELKADSVEETTQRAATEVRVISRGPDICNNIYGEMPFMDVSSRYVVFIKLARTHDSPAEDREAHRRVEVWRADLKNDAVQQIAAEVFGVRGMAVSPDQRYFYYVSSRDGKPSAETQAEQITRVDIATLESRPVILKGDGRRLRTLGSITPDNRCYIAGASLGPGRYGIVRIDLGTGVVKVIHEGSSDIFNAHPQVEPRLGRDILIQHNRGAEVDDDGKVLRSYGKAGPTLYMIDIEGGNRRPLPVGAPYTRFIQGHQAWVGRTGSILFTTRWGPLKYQAEVGNLWILRPGEPKPQPAARGYSFWHCSASRCGRFFVADTRGGAIVASPDGSGRGENRYRRQKIAEKGLIVIGSIATGKTRILCATKAACGEAQYSHPHPYLSPDSRWAIFNTEQDGTPHVAAARIPDGLLEELNRP